MNFWIVLTTLSSLFSIPYLAHAASAEQGSSAFGEDPSIEHGAGRLSPVQPRTPSSPPVGADEATHALQQLSLAQTGEGGDDRDEQAHPHAVAIPEGFEPYEQMIEAWATRLETAADQDYTATVDDVYSAATQRLTLLIMGLRELRTQMREAEGVRYYGAPPARGDTTELADHILTQFDVASFKGYEGIFDNTGEVAAYMFRNRLRKAFLKIYKRSERLSKELTTRYPQGEPVTVL